jgi:hypothetical protein
LIEIFIFYYKPKINGGLDMANKKRKRPNETSNQNNKNKPNNKFKNNKNNNSKPINNKNEINEKLKQVLLEKLIEKLK